MWITSNVERELILLNIPLLIEANPQYDMFLMAMRKGKCPSYTYRKYRVTSGLNTLEPNCDIGEKLKSLDNILIE